MRMKKELQLAAITICTLSIVALGYFNYADAAAYIKFDGVDGEAKDSDHKGWIDVLSVSQSIARSMDSGLSARSSAAASFSDITVTKELDKSSPKLAEAVATGKVIPKVEFHLTSTHGTYYKYELTNVMVTSYSMSGEADERPTEEVSFNFTQIKTTYTEYDADGKSKGNVEYTWKVEEGTS